MYLYQKDKDKPDSALWLIRQYNILKDSQIARLVELQKIQSVRYEIKIIGIIII